MPVKVLVLCHGNVNRSAAVACMLNNHPNKFEVRSGALKPNPGTPPAAAKMRRAMKEAGFSLESHRARAVTEEDFLWADLVLYMDNGNFKRIEANWQRFLEKCKNLALWDTETASRIPDPGYMGKDSPEFKAVVKQLIRCTQNFINSVRT